LLRGGFISKFTLLRGRFQPNLEAVGVVVHGLTAAAVEHVDPHFLERPGQALAEQMHAEFNELWRDQGRRFTKQRAVGRA